jgi:hypothetical protein
MKKLFKKIARIIQKEGGTVLPALVNKVNMVIQQFTYLHRVALNGIFCNGLNIYYICQRFTTIY